MSRRDELLQNMADEINNDERLGRINWDYISIVVEINGRNVSQSGFAYKEKEIEPVYVDSFDFDDYALELHDEIKQDGYDGFKSMIFQLESSSNKMKCDFEYDDEKRWVVSPDNIEKMKEELRPNFS